MKEQQSNVEELIKRLPKGYEKACIETKAIERRREIKTPLDLIKLILLYLIGGYSQIEMSVIASELEIAKIADTAFLKKFAKSKDWLSWMVSEIKPKPIVEYDLPKGFEGYTITAVDASNVTEKGRSGQTFRLHYAINLMTLSCIEVYVNLPSLGLRQLRTYAVKTPDSELENVTRRNKPLRRH